MGIDNAPRALRTFRMRRKADTGVADLARWTSTDPNSFDVTVGGAATNGNYIVTITPQVQTGPYPPVTPNTDESITAIAITVVRAGGAPATNTNLATQFVTNTNTILVATNPGDHANLSTYIESVSSSGAVVSFIVKRNAPPFRVTLSAPAPGTLALAPDDIFPIVFDSIGFSHLLGPRTKLGIVLLPVDSSGVPLDPGSLTADITVLRVFDRGGRNGRDIPSTPVGVEAATTATAWPAGAAYRIPSGGGRFGVILGAVGGAVGAGVLSVLEVHVREVTE